MRDRQSTTAMGSALATSVTAGGLNTEAPEHTEPTNGPAVAAAMRGNENGSLGRFVDGVHAYVREHIRNADTKAVFFFGATTALLAFLQSLEGANAWVKAPQAWNALDVVGFGAVVALGASAATAAWTVVPRLGGSKPGLLYFNAIAEHGSATEYANCLLGATEEVLVNEKARHCYVLACICGNKYRCLRASMWCGLMGLLCTLAISILGH